MGFEMILRAIGLTDDAIAKLKAMLNPDKIEALANELRARFDAMEQRNLEMHRMLVELHAASPNAAGRAMDALALDGGYRDITPENPHGLTATNFQLNGGSHERGNSNGGSSDAAGANSGG